ncbi:uncharacterized protein STEHIDRAFT_113735 [Stereum hirsutum FP-91666 SS1]|uniref:uncharacterized protein n=1 Tax=Stereum hirsutum (strain FP-91666) TaxID=721885 RepID=UPI000444951F|nr:uncharacterized protein STEHIDRAFT_113735 [Stereum hirsutum FP-91666 SS1]EIM83663.1 hypothetical protein STEHIDRAFT_113735 [Stereum hirsutum FP-91666 SS1]
MESTSIEELNILREVSPVWVWRLGHSASPLLDGDRERPALGSSAQLTKSYLTLPKELWQESCGVGSMTETSTILLVLQLGDFIGLIVNCNSSAPITGNLYTSLTSALLPNDETKQSMLDDMVRKGEAAGRDAYVGGFLFSPRDVGSAKLIICVGCLKSDFNTDNFTYPTPKQRTIELHSDHTLANSSSRNSFRLAVCASKLSVPQFEARFPTKDPLCEETTSHVWMWPRIGQFFREKDVIVSETAKFPEEVSDGRPAPRPVLPSLSTTRTSGLSHKDGIGVASLSARPHIMASTIDSDPAHEGLPITHAELLARIVAVESRLRRTVENQIRFEGMVSRLLSEINAINDRCSETDKICTDNCRDIVIIDNNVSTLNARVEEGYDDLKAHCARIATLYHRRYRQYCAYPINLFGQDSFSAHYKQDQAPTGVQEKPDIQMQGLIRLTQIQHWSEEGGGLHDVLLDTQPSDRGFGRTRASHNIAAGAALSSRHGVGPTPPILPSKPYSAYMSLSRNARPRHCSLSTSTSSANGQIPSA